MTNLQVAVLGGCLFSAPFCMFAAWMLVASRYLDRIESVFSNSRMVVGNKEVYVHAGMLGKLMRVGSISAMLAMKGLCVRKGMLDAEDVRKAPDDLKKLLVRLWFTHLLLFVMLTLFCIWIKFLR